MSALQLLAQKASQLAIAAVLFALALPLGPAGAMASNSGEHERLGVARSASERHANSHVLVRIKGTALAQRLLGPGIYLRNSNTTGIAHITLWVGLGLQATGGDF